MTNKVVKLHNTTSDTIIFYYNVLPSQFYETTTIKPSDMKEIVLSGGNSKYFVGIILNNGKMMCPMAFYSDVSIRLSLEDGTYYYHLEFVENDCQEVPDDSLIWFSSWVVNLYQRDAQLNQKESIEMITLMVKQFIKESGIQMSAHYFAKCYCNFLGDDDYYEIAKSIYQGILNDYRHKVNDLSKTIGI